MKIRLLLLAVMLVFACSSLWAQNAELSGLVKDQSGAVVPNAEVKAIRQATGTERSTQTNHEGVYALPGLEPGVYNVEVRMAGFQTLVQSGLTLNVGDRVRLDLQLKVGSASQVVTVEGGAPLVNTQDASVSTVVDRQFAENLPMNGRSFQTLIQLTPGVVVVPSTLSDEGQFSVNGQRAGSNYWMLDGVSANVGTSATFQAGNSLSGSLGSFSVLGGTNSLVSVDAMQEFRIQTSTYAPEFGRTPGGQVSIVTRSGTNEFHGAAFEYFRNDVLDANDWFNGATNPPLRKPPERQNDFGGVFGGPILRNRTFFFFSYEGLQLRLPQTALSTVPDLKARQSAIPAMQPFLNAYPLPNGPDNLTTGIAQFNASFSNRSTLNAYSLRLDHKATDRLTFLGRSSYSPSDLILRAVNTNTALSDLSTSRITTQATTLGSIWNLSPAVSNDVRFNYSRTNASSAGAMDNFGGAVPLTSPFPSPITAANGQFGLFIRGLSYRAVIVGTTGGNVQRQINAVDNLSVQKGSHSLKFGIDFRRLSPVHRPQEYSQVDFFANLASAQRGQLQFSSLSSARPALLLFHNVGLFAQDTWRVLPRLTLTYGLRWDVDAAPSSVSGPNIAAATGFDLSNLSNLALAPVGTPPFQTTYSNLAPRVGLAYQYSQKPNWETVLRGGFGVFYDLASSEAGNLLVMGGYPFLANSTTNGGTFPLSASAAAPPPIVPPGGGSGSLAAFDPRLKLPYTLQWNAAVEQSVGRQQTISFSYVGSIGRRLIQSANVTSPNPQLGLAYLVSNAATSDYDALQMQFQRRMSHGLQALASYTWAHSIDTASAGSAQFGSVSNGFTTSVNPNANRGPSDFDIRSTFSAGLTYDITVPRINAFANAILRGWSLQSLLQFRTAPPVDLFDTKFSTGLNGFAVDVRPDIIDGQPPYLLGPQYPGGKAFNLAAFSDPPIDAKGNPVRQGHLGRNALRGFGATQWDFAVHRDFPIHESVKLQFRTELFNVLNHPNFGPPIADLSDPRFGTSVQTLARSLIGFGNTGNGGFSPLYQMGGPRSIQLALKLQF